MGASPEVEMGAAPDASSLRDRDDVAVVFVVEVAAVRPHLHGHREEVMSQAEAVLRQKVKASSNEISSSSRPSLRPIRIVAEALRHQLQLSRERDALGDSRGMASFGRETGCRC